LACPTMGKASSRLTNIGAAGRLRVLPRVARAVTVARGVPGFMSFSLEPRVTSLRRAVTCAGVEGDQFLLAVLGRGVARRTCFASATNDSPAAM